MEYGELKIALLLQRFHSYGVYGSKNGMVATNVTLLRSWCVEINVDCDLIFFAKKNRIFRCGYNHLKNKINKVCLFSLLELFV